MEICREVKIGYYTETDFSEIDAVSYLKTSPKYHDRIAATLADYLVTHSKAFEKASFVFTDESSVVYPNGTLKGMIRYINHSEVDIAPQSYAMHYYDKRVDFVYPFNIVQATFIIREPEYKPGTFGIFKTISASVWITIIAFMVFILLSYYAILKRKYAFHKIFLHLFGVFLRQGIILKPSSMTENLLLYSWIVGAMLFCLAYDSVFLSFLAIPPVIKIKDVSQLAAAIASGEYHCIARPDSGVYREMMKSKRKNLRIIGEKLQTNNLIFIILSGILFTIEANKISLSWQIWI